MKRCGLGLIGYGGVARALVSVIDAKRAELNATHGVDLIVTGVSDIHGGCVTDPRGVDLAVLKTLPRTAGALEALPGGRSKDDNRAVVSLPETDIVVEATVTNPETGEPALSYCREALSRGKHLVTTNKGPVAFALGELLTLAQRNGREIGFEGTVMSGTPLLRLAADNLAGCKILSFRGILNGTANYVLGQMESGATMEDAVRQAQALGFAEADPNSRPGGIRRADEGRDPVQRAIRR